MSGLPATRMQQTGANSLYARPRHDARTPFVSPVNSAQITSIEAYVADRREREARAAFVDQILERLARHRTGSNDVAQAFEPDELRRLRCFLAVASEAKSRVVRAQRRIESRA